MKRIILFVIITLVANQVFAQNLHKIDSLREALRTDISERQEVDIYNQIAEEYHYFDSLQVTTHTKKALQLAKKINYQEGIVNAYYFDGYMMMDNGYYPQAIKKFQQALIISDRISYAKGKSSGL